MIYPIRLYGDPVLRQKARTLASSEPIRVPGFEAVSLTQLAESMLETMHEARGVGLAAPQIGLPVRLFVAAEFADEEEEGDADREPRSRLLQEWVFINPEIEILDKRKVWGTEGCLSIPNVFEEVPRPQAVRVNYQDVEGSARSVEFVDFMARVMLHENDHLLGKMFLDHLGPEVTDDHRKVLTQMQRQAKAYLRHLRNQKGG